MSPWALHAAGASSAALMYQLVSAWESALLVLALYWTMLLRLGASEASRAPCRGSVCMLCRRPVTYMAVCGTSPLSGTNHLSSKSVLCISVYLCSHHHHTTSSLRVLYMVMPEVCM